MTFHSKNLCCTYRYSNTWGCGILFWCVGKLFLAKLTVMRFPCHTLSFRDMWNLPVTSNKFEKSSVGGSCPNHFFTGLNCLMPKLIDENAVTLEFRSCCEHKIFAMNIKNCNDLLENCMRLSVKLFVYRMHLHPVELILYSSTLCEAGGVIINKWINIDAIIIIAPPAPPREELWKTRCVSKTYISTRIKDLPYSTTTQYRCTIFGTGTLTSISSYT